jgi:hypothetical protein
MHSLDGGLALDVARVCVLREAVERALEGVAR